MLFIPTSVHFCFLTVVECTDHDCSRIPLEFVPHWPIVIVKTSICAGQPLTRCQLVSEASGQDSLD